MKFEISEKILTNSRLILYLRLFMIKEYGIQRRELEEKNPLSPALDDLTTQAMGAEYKKIIFSLINKLNLAHHTPGQKVMKQNESIVDDYHEFIDDDEGDHVFFIITGNYAVLTMQFDNKRRQESL